MRMVRLLILLSMLLTGAAVLPGCGGADTADASTKAAKPKEAPKPAGPMHVFLENKTRGDITQVAVVLNRSMSFGDMDKGEKKKLKHKTFERTKKAGVHWTDHRGDRQGESVNLDSALGRGYQGNVKFTITDRKVRASKAN